MKIPPRLLDWVVWAAIAGAAVMILRRKDSGPPEGIPAPAIDLPLVGKDARFDLSAQRGKAVVIEMFASWCGTCRRAAPVLAEAYRAHPASEVTFVGVSINDSLDGATRAKEHWGIPYEVALDDGSVSAGYKVSLLPTIVVIGRDGKVRHTVTGVPSKKDLARWIAEP